MDETSSQDWDELDAFTDRLGIPGSAAAITTGDDPETEQSWSHAWKAIWGNSGNLRWVIVGTGLAFLCLFGFAWTQSAIVATEIFSGLIAALAFLAFLAAILTVELTLPTFRTLLARPKLELHASIKGVDGAVHDLHDGDVIHVEGCRFELRATVMNSGNARAVTGINVWALESCGLLPLDNYLKICRTSLEKLIYGDDEPGAPCKVAIAQTEVIPAIPYSYLVAVESPRPETWPICVGVFTSIENPRTGAYETLLEVVRANVVTTQK